MVVINDTAIRTNRNINTGFFEIFVSSFSDFDNSGSLSATDPLLFTGDTDGTAADTDFDEVCTGFGKETETFTVNDISGTDLYSVTVVFTDPVDSQLLPFRETLGRVDTKHISTGFNQCRNTFSVVTGIDSRTDDITFLGIQKFQWVFFM